MSDDQAWQIMLAVVAVRAMSPFVFATAIAAGYFLRAWWQGAIAALLIGLAYEAVFAQGGFVMERAMLAAVAALLWVTIVFTIRRGIAAWEEGKERLEKEKAEKEKDR